MIEKAKHLSIQIDSSLLQAMKQMDLHRTKMLLAFDGFDFKSLITLGDIQRALIGNIPVSESVGKIIDTAKEFAYVEDSLEDIKQKMFNMRCEYIPVLNKDGTLNDIIFWKDIFPSKVFPEKQQFDFPVIIMAGGEGMRMKPLTQILPKPLLPLGNKTILEIIMDSFVDSGCHDFYLSVNYKADLIRNYFSALKNENYRISYLQEEKPLGTAGSLHLLRDKVNKTFFVSNCDILVEQDYSELLEYHFSNKNELTLVAALKSFPIAYGIINTRENGILESIDEKPELNFKINTGFYILEPHLIEEIPQNEHYHITHLISKLIREKRRVGVFPISEDSWKDLGNWDEYIKNFKD